MTAAPVHDRHVAPLSPACPGCAPAIAAARAHLAARPAAGDVITGTCRSFGIPRTGRILAELTPGVYRVAVTSPVPATPYAIVVTR